MMHKIRHDFAGKIFGRMNGQFVLRLVRSNRGGRTITEIVEQDPGLVSEVWCRKIFRQLLISLERQYAMQLPHRTISPDTVVIRENGEPLLLSLQSDPQPEVARDLTALAKAVHYAISRERASTRPLRTLALEGYSDSIVTAIDRCMAHDPAVRPHTIDELRTLLGIVALKNVPQARAAGKSISVPASQSTVLRSLRLLTPRRSVHRLLPRVLAGVTSTVVLVALLTILGSMHDLGRLNDIRLAGPRTVDSERIRNDARTPVAVTLGLPKQAHTAPRHVNAPLSEWDAADGGAGQFADRERENTDVSSIRTRRTPANRGTKKSPARLTQSVAADMPPQDPGRKAADPSNSAQRLAPPTLKAVASDAVVNLHIRPWGRVSVDGVDHGVSPPVKRLTLSQGRHLILVKNANSDARVLEIDTTKGERRIAVDFTEEQD